MKKGFRTLKNSVSSYLITRLTLQSEHISDLNYYNVLRLQNHFLVNLILSTRDCAISGHRSPDKPPSSFQPPTIAFNELNDDHNPSNMSKTNFYVVTSPTNFQELLSADLSRVSVINFWAPWAEPCKQMNEVIKELSKKYQQILFLQVRIQSPLNLS
jgi:thiol-disulfide isomerase/thioredoxin